MRLEGREKEEKRWERGENHVDSSRMNDSEGNHPPPPTQLDLSVFLHPGFGNGNSFSGSHDLTTKQQTNNNQSKLWKDKARKTDSRKVNNVGSIFTIIIIVIILHGMKINNKCISLLNLELERMSY